MLGSASVQYQIFPENAVCVRKSPWFSQPNPMRIVRRIAGHDRVGHHGLAAFSLSEPAKEYATIQFDFRQFTEFFILLAHELRSVASSSASIKVDGEAGGSGILDYRDFLNDHAVFSRNAYRYNGRPCLTSLIRINGEQNAVCSWI